MKKYIVILFFFLFSNNAFSQDTKAEFPGGNEAFKTEFMNMVHAYIDIALYAIQGEVTFIFNIDEKGKVNNLDVLPKFKNNEMFIDDMKYAVKKVKKKWTPATKDGVPINSKYVLKVNFSSNTYDHD